MQYLSKILILTLVYFGLSQITIQAAEMKEPLHPEWSFEGPLGKFERASLQRGYQVYTEVSVSYTHLTLPTKRIV